MLFDCLVIFLVSIGQEVLANKICEEYKEELLYMHPKSRLINGVQTSFIIVDDVPVLKNLIWQTGFFFNNVPNEDCNRHIELCLPSNDKSIAIEHIECEGQIIILRIFLSEMKGMNLTWKEEDVIFDNEKFNNILNLYFEPLEKQHV